VRDLEEVMIRTAAEFGVVASRQPGLTGAWVDVPAENDGSSAEKLAAIGVRIARWITSHGFAFNVNTDLAGFNLIVPCGIADKGVTSLGRLLGREVAMDEVEEACVCAFAAVFDRFPIENPTNLDPHPLANSPIPS
jgi:lipoyl(octanoyl) transferase